MNYLLSEDETHPDLAEQGKKKTTAPVFMFQIPPIQLKLPLAQRLSLFKVKTEMSVLKVSMAT